MKFGSNQHQPTREETAAATKEVCGKLHRCASRFQVECLADTVGDVTKKDEDAKFQSDSSSALLE